MSRYFDSTKHQSWCPRMQSAYESLVPIYEIDNQYFYIWEIHGLLSRVNLELEEAHEKGWNTDKLERDRQWLEDIISHHNQKYPSQS